MPSSLCSPVRQEVGQLLRHLLPDVQPQLLDTELPLTLAQAAAIQSQHREANHLEENHKKFKFLLYKAIHLLGPAAVVVRQTELEYLAHQLLPVQAEAELLVILRAGAVIHNGGAELNVVIVKL